MYSVSAVTELTMFDARNVESLYITTIGPPSAGLALLQLFHFH